MSVDSIGSALTGRLAGRSETLSRPLVGGTQHAVSTGHYLASQAAFRILDAGGNAVDAGVAAGLVLAVAQSDVVNFAGVAPMLFRSATTGRVRAIAGLGYWPRATPPDYFIKNHNGAIPHGPCRTVVPAAPDAWITVLSEFGTMTFGEVATEAIRIAREGFVMYPLMASVIHAFAEQYARWDSNAAIYLPGGHPPQPGDLFRQTDLARTIQYMCDEERAAGGTRLQGLKAARDAFYRGDIASAIVKYHRENGGFLREDDLANFHTPVEDSVEAHFGGYRLHTPQAWCQEPVLIQILRLLDELKVDGLEHNSPEYIHRFVETIKTTFKDRHDYFGDPDFVKIPLDMLLSREYASRSAAAMDLRRSSSPFGEAGTESISLDTSYVCVVDCKGNAFSATPSDASVDTPVIPGTGLCPSSRGSQSWGDPSLPSGVAPGKRPRLTPSPAMAVFDDGKVMPFGTPGGDAQLQAMAQVFLNVTKFGMNLQEAVDAPRVASFDFPDSFEPHSRLPGRVAVESGLGNEVIEAIRKMGHDAVAWPDRNWRAGGVCIIEHDPALKRNLAGADPRRPSYALAR
jgi:gamma-glutamyltranspeptidase/glutathione hydrolase